MILALIPCRLESKRLKNKVLLKLENITIIEHVIKRAQLCKFIDQIAVCTNSNLIKKVAKNLNIKTFKSKKKHNNGTERIAEYPLSKKVKYVIDIQGDEPLFDPRSLNELIKFHKKNSHYDIVIPSTKLNKGDNKNEVKIISNDQGKILYLTRSKSPYEFKKKNKFYQKHLSVISFKPRALKKFAKLRRSKLEKIEGIELLRALENNFKLGTFISNFSSQAVDVKEDYLKAIKLMKSDKIRKLYK